MGSIARVNVVYEELDGLLEQPEVPVYGAFMDGRPVYGQSLPAAGMLVMGNEAHGISEAVSEKVTHRIGIPQYGGEHTESLNVAMATAILLNEIRRPTQR
jgi:TrmH family RNA methyltransferase